MTTFKKVLTVVVVVFGLVVALGASREYFGPHISKFIGPTDYELVYIDETKVPVDAYSKLPTTFIDCTSDRTALFLVQAGKVRYRSDCTVEVIDIKPKSKDSLGSFMQVIGRPESTEKLHTFTAADGKTFFHVRSREAKEIRITTKSIDGLDYVIEFISKVESNPYALLIGPTEDTIIGYQGKFRVRFTQANALLRPAWKLVGDIDYQTLR